MLQDVEMDGMAGPPPPLPSKHVNGDDGIRPTLPSKQPPPPKMRRPSNTGKVS